jgi:hypothetical protein
MGRLQLALDQGALADGGALDSVGRHEDIGRLGLIIVVRRAEKPEALVGNFQITGAGLGNLDLRPLAILPPMGRIPVGITPVGIIPVGIIPVRRILIRPTVVFETTHTSKITEKRELNCSELEN